MKFLFRCLIVLAVAVVFGVALYYAVQALPSDSPSTGLSGTQSTPHNEEHTSPNPPARPEHSGSTRRGEIGWRSIFDVGRRIIMFSILVFISVLGKNFIFERKQKK